MKYVSSLAFSSLLITCSPAAFSLNPAEGFYGGVLLGGSYTPKAKINFLAPNAATPVTCPVGTCTAVTNAKLAYGGYGNIGGQIGYKIDDFRIELEPLYNYNRYEKITVGTTKYNSPKSSTGIRFKGSTGVAAIMLNGLVDFFMPTDTSGPSLYAGAGIGYANVDNTIRFYCNNVTIECTKISQSKDSAIAQGILGVAYHLDDMTWFGLDYRYLTTRKIPMIDSRVQAHTINLSVNGSFC